ncbi:unnamed protein product [Adineta steineri]|uniref:Secreted protein n=1 Tax=Adineta steineri TaxID=433720 RepID=A0A814IF20_9BILA|nr:unnamed protein product [Adineta steineri]CAF1043829.1 unnamed protein product [Adineta steineri]
MNFKKAAVILLTLLTTGEHNNLLKSENLKFRYDIIYALQAAELEKETMKVRQQLIEQQEEARACTNPQQQAVCAAVVSRTLDDVLDTGKKMA